MTGPGIVIQFIDIVLIVSGLFLFLLVVLVEAPGSGGGGDPGPALLEPPDADQRSPHPRRGHAWPPAEPRALWWVQTGAAAVNNVPDEVQAEALKILETLRTLDVLFPDLPRRTPPGTN